MNDENKIGYYAIIPATVLFNEKIKANEKLLYAVITVLSNKEGYCFASNSYLGRLLNAQPHTISKWISHLKELGVVCLDIIKNDKGEIIQRRIYINDIPYVTKMTYPYTIKMSEGMSQKRQDNNINIKIDRLFNYIIKKESGNPENMTSVQEVKFMEILEKLELNYTEELLKIFTEDNIEKLKIIIYALKDLSISNRSILLNRATREKLIYVYDNCKNKQEEYQDTSKEINNFFEYYYISLIKELEKAR